MKFHMILAHDNDDPGLGGVFLEYIKFPMVVNNPDADGDTEPDLIKLYRMSQVHAWAKREYGADYEIITLDTKHARSALKITGSLSPG